MSSLRGTIRYLYGLEYRGMKFGLRNIRTLVKEAGHPERAFPSIHVAGTNGKGSTSAFLASAFTEAGYRTGLYTSPHLVRFTERIRIDGREIDEARLVSYVERLRPLIERTGATFFEATTCVAFLYFADEGVDVAVIETGLGGRLDATNVLRPLVSVVTNVSLEHTEILGTTVRAIAREKAGIFKRSVPAVTGATDPDALDVLRKKASACGVRLRQSSEAVSMSRGSIALRTRRFRTVGFRPGLAGAHQYRNAALALSALDALMGTPAGKKRFRRLTSPVIRRGFGHVVKNTGLRGRLETLRLRGRVLLLDVAHNPAGMSTLVSQLRAKKLSNIIAVFGVMKDKNYRAMLASLARQAGTIIAVAPVQKRALSAPKLYRAGIAQGYRMLRGGTVAEGIRKAVLIRGKRTVLITGSHYVVGEALSALRSENA